MTPNRTLALAKPKPKTNWFEFCLVLFRVNWNTDWEKKHEYGRTQFGGLLESEEAGQEPLLPIGTHHAFLLVQKFSISKLCCEFICSFQLNFMHGNCWPYDIGFLVEHRNEYCMNFKSSMPTCWFWVDLIHLVANWVFFKKKKKFLLGHMPSYLYSETGSTFSVQPYSCYLSHCFSRFVSLCNL